VEIAGVVQDEAEVGGHLRLTLRSGRNQCQIWVLNHEGYGRLGLTDSWVKVRGIAASRFDNQRRLEGFQIYIDSLADIEIVERPTLDAFASPVTLSRELFQYRSIRGKEHRLCARETRSKRSVSGKATPALRG
jgi:hypothetical protein